MRSLVLEDVESSGLHVHSAMESGFGAVRDGVSPDALAPDFVEVGVWALGIELILAAGDGFHVAETDLASEAKGVRGWELPDGHVRVWR